MRNTENLVSVVVPVYNAEKTIINCVESILQQSHCQLEVLLVDDGSQDASLKLLMAFQEQDYRVKVFTQPNGGVSAARNLALAHATGGYVQFVDSDDFLLSDATAVMLRAMRTQNCDLSIAAYYEKIGKSKQRKGYLKSDSVLSQSLLLDKLCAHPNSFYYSVLWNKLYKRDIIQKSNIRFDEALPWGEDFAFNTQYMRYVSNAAILERPVYEYVRNFSGLALSTGRHALLHPVYAIRVKMILHQYYKQLYIDTGLYQQYRHILPQYLFKFNISD